MAIILTKFFSEIKLIMQRKSSMTMDTIQPADILTFLSDVKDSKERDNFIKEQLEKINSYISKQTPYNKEKRSQEIANRIRNYELFNLKKVLVSKLDFSND